MEIAALLISLVALAASAVVARQSTRLARDSNALPVLVELFAEHRSVRLGDARTFVCEELGPMRISNLRELPEEQFMLVRDLCWFYDNLGALVAHDVVDVQPISGYLGGSAIAAWRVLRPLIENERQRRGEGTDPSRWQVYFENLVAVLENLPPEKARQEGDNWVL